jgi:hypothetical protein
MVTDDYVVRLGSRVRVRDPDGEAEFAVVPPEDADAAAERSRPAARSATHSWAGTPAMRCGSRPRRRADGDHRWRARPEGQPRDGRRENEPSPAGHGLVSRHLVQARPRALLPGTRSAAGRRRPRQHGEPRQGRWPSVLVSWGCARPSRRASEDELGQDHGDDVARDLRDGLRGPRRTVRQPSPSSISRAICCAHSRRDDCERQSCGRSARRTRARDGEGSCLCGRHPHEAAPGTPDAVYGAEAADEDRPAPEALPPLEGQVGVQADARQALRQRAEPCCSLI